MIRYTWDRIAKVKQWALSSDQILPCSRGRKLVIADLLMMNLHARGFNTKFYRLAQARSYKIRFRCIPHLFECGGIDVLHPTTENNCCFWQLTTEATNGVAHVSWAACVEIDQTDECNTGGIEPKHVSRRERFSSFDTS